MNRYYLVRNVAGINDGVQVASGTIAGSPALNTSGVVTDGDYALYKVPVDGTPPTGASVTELALQEAQLATQSELFNTMPSVEFIQFEQGYSQRIRAQFMAAQSTLSIADADALFTILEPTSHALSSGSLNLAYTRFNASAADQATKNMFNPLFEEFFTKYPRSLA